VPTTPTPGSPGSLRLATRGSPLALWQAERVAALLAASGVPGCELVVVSTAGDRMTEVPLDRIGGQGVFVKEVQAAVLDGRADVAVHSAKDLPALTPEGLVLACVPERADPRDALVGATLDALAPGALVATGSVRRRAQLAWLRPDLTFCDLRGNMTRRLERARAVGAGVVAYAALERLGLTAEAAEVLDVGRLLPQVGQGALALECRADDDGTRRALGAVDDAMLHRAVRAERAFLDELGGGCTLPVGALARPAPGGGGSDGAGSGGTGSGAGGRGAGSGGDEQGPIELDAMLASRDGHVMLRRQATGTDPGALGRALAHELLDDCGGRSLADWAPAGGRE